MILVLDRISVSSEGVDIHDVTLAVARGETTLLLGSAGAGKTTMLRTIAGFERADRGTIVLDGEDASSLPPEARPTAFVSNIDSLFPHLSVFENVAYGLRLRRVENVDDRVTVLLNRTGLSDVRDLLPAEVSPACRWRAALARAAAIAPAILLVDEPPIDPAGGIALARVLATSVGATLIAATTDRTAALSIADRLVFLRNGRIEQQGTPAELYHRPATPHVADYVSRANLIECQVDGIGVGVILIQLFGRRVGIPAGEGSALEYGDRALLVARPETLRLVNDADGIPGVVRSAAFLGATAAYEVDVDGIPLSILEPDLRGGRLHLSGSSVRVGFIQESLQLIPLT